ncbi:hypothetical protein [Egicoccus sp. AB-alg2]|uniref:hypothetical protein n=1 Tax=Egicoccus sp. AB-alg2 TaxID=3242693 RepID=UPI00359EC1D1
MNEPADTPDGSPRADRSAAELEAARLRYELSRLRDRRPVRAALALTSWRRDGAAAAWQTLRGRPPRWDAAGPDDVPARPRYPHLRVAHLSPDPVSAGVAPSLRIRPGDVRAVRRDRVDLLLVDDAGWEAGALAEAVAAARDVGAAVVAVGGPAAAALAAAGVRPTLRVALAGPDLGGDPGEEPPRVAPHIEAESGVAERAALRWLPAVDPRVDAPVGCDPRVVDGRGLHLAAVLRHAARGEVPILPADAVLREALGPVADDVLVESATGDTAAAVDARVAALREDGDALAALSVRLRRHVLRTHGRAARLDEVVEALGLDVPPRRRVSLLLATRRPELLHQVTADLARQTQEDLELVLAVHGDEPVPDRLALTPAAVVQVGAERPLGAVLNAALDASTGGLVAKIDDDDRYGRHHLDDLVLALDYSGAEVVGKRRHAVHDVAAGTLRVQSGQHEERWEDHLPGATMLVRGEVLRALRWRLVPNAVDTELVRAVHLAGGACYSTHRFGFVRTRHGDHTFAGDASLGGAALSPADLAAYLDV